MLFQDVLLKNAIFCQKGRSSCKGCPLQTKQKRSLKYCILWWMLFNKRGVVSLWSSVNQLKSLARYFAWAIQSIWGYMVESNNIITYWGIWFSDVLRVSLKAFISRREWQSGINNLKDSWKKQVDIEFSLLKLVYHI